MIRVIGIEAIETVFDEQAIATMNTFGDAFGIIAGTSQGVCPDGIDTDEAPMGRFECTREAGHPGPHVACGTRAVAVWD
jgi:hypothetical protein